MKRLMMVMVIAACADVTVGREMAEVTPYAPLQRTCTYDMPTEVLIAGVPAPVNKLTGIPPEAPSLSR